MFIYKLRREKIIILKAQLSGDGNFIDIRYRLTRPDKIISKTQVYITDDNTGNKFYVMKLPRYGLMQTKHGKYQNTGILLFRNHNNILKLDSEVTLVFGKLEVKNIKIK